MLGRRRAITPAQIAEAWRSSREARIEMRLLVGAELEQVGTAYAGIVEPLRQAYEETANPGFALLALRTLQPTVVSSRGLGRSLHYAHAPRWSIDAIVRAVEQAYPGPVQEAQQRWLAAEPEVGDRSFKELEGLSEREVQRVLSEWFSRTSASPASPTGDGPEEDPSKA
jgi:hypothetical protein